MTRARMARVGLGLVVGLLCFHVGARAGGDGPGDPDPWPRLTRSRDILGPRQPKRTFAHAIERPRREWFGWAGFQEGDWVERERTGSGLRGRAAATTLQRTILKSKSKDELTLEVRKQRSRGRGADVTTRTIARPTPWVPGATGKTKTLRVAGKREACWYTRQEDTWSNFGKGSVTEVRETWVQKDAPSLILRLKKRTDGKVTWEYKIGKWDATHRLGGKQVTVHLATAKGWDGRLWVEEAYVIDAATGILLRWQKKLVKSPHPDDARTLVFGRMKTLYEVVAVDEEVRIGRRTVRCIRVVDSSEGAFDKSPDPAFKPTETWYSPDVPGGFVKGSGHSKWSAGVLSSTDQVVDFHAREP